MLEEEAGGGGEGAVDGRVRLSSSLESWDSLLQITAHCKTMAGSSGPKGAEQSEVIRKRYSPLPPGSHLCTGTGSLMVDEQPVAGMAPAGDGPHYRSAI